jgi:hypothetical protein
MPFHCKCTMEKIEKKYISVLYRLALFYDEHEKKSREEKYKYISVLQIHIFLLFVIKTFYQQRVSEVAWTGDYQTRHVINKTTEDFFTNNNNLPYRNFFFCSTSKSALKLFIILQMFFKVCLQEVRSFH